MGCYFGLAALWIHHFLKRHARSSLCISLSFNEEVTTIHAEEAENHMAASNVDE